MATSVKSECNGQASMVMSLISLCPPAFMPHQCIVYPKKSDNIIYSKDWTVSLVFSLIIFLLITFYII